ncbi:MAG: DMT family transporter [Methylobacteriaceae bacterium]|nr:DMT family transporter [Methylobacteriaceae bacterium]
MTGFDYLLYVLVVFAWSTSWIALKLQLGTVAPEVSIALRFAIAALLMFGWASLSGVRLAFPLSEHLRFALLGVLLFGTNFVLFYYGGLSTPSGLLAVVFSCAALFNLILSAAIFRQRPERSVAFGAVLGFAGVLAMFAPRIFSAGLDGSALGGLALCVLGTLSFCLGNMVSVAVQRSGIGVISANSWGMAYGALFLALVALLRGLPFTIEPSLAYLGSLIWLSTVSSVLAFAAYLTLLGRIGAARAGYSTVMFPVFALLISTVVEGYVWTPIALVGLVLALAGNFIVLRKR